MASSTSSDLKLELITTGEKSGTWGTITNTNLQILEQSASGYQEIDMAGASVTLLFISPILPLSAPPPLLANILFLGFSFLSFFLGPKVSIIFAILDFLLFGHRILPLKPHIN